MNDKSKRKRTQNTILRMTMGNQYFYGASWLSLDKTLFEYEVRAFKEYIFQSSASIDKIQKELEQRWKEHSEQEPSNDDLYFFYEDEANKVFKLVPHIAFSSLYVSIAALFESSLKKACDSIGHPTLTWKDMAGNGDFEKVKAFFNKVALIDLTPINKDWQRVIDFFKLRNVIVHSGSKVDLDDNKIIIKQDLRSLFARYPKSISMQQWGEFHVIETDILFDFLAAIEAFIVTLYEILVQRLKNNQAK